MKKKIEREDPVLCQSVVTVKWSKDTVVQYIIDELATS